MNAQPDGGDGDSRGREGDRGQAAWTRHYEQVALRQRDPSARQWQRLSWRRAQQRRRLAVLGAAILLAVICGAFVATLSM